MPVKVLQHKPQGGIQNLFVCCPRDRRYQMPCVERIQFPSLFSCLLFLSFRSLGVVGGSARQEVTVIASVLMFAVKEQCRP